MERRLLAMAANLTMGRLTNKLQTRVGYVVHVLTPKILLRTAPCVSSASCSARSSVLSIWLACHRRVRKAGREQLNNKLKVFSYRITSQDQFLDVLQLGHETGKESMRWSHCTNVM
ncbi:hypothetical protein PR002_g30711 [Phytophthora rubi]|uniref:Uncharacterized protein n=1 Tax=Phytophthora rubi TaxID=129364 RepID=A0A6A3GJ46_9STRA|nr:hypothetical protein PR002_g30711 [Phytophthora rubi]